MKPVKLKFSGLQSYREEQEINFEDLGALGIFGVFGPTGAGKSTILDAISLALFGKIERAKGGTRGVVNQYEDRLYVSFAFLMGSESYLAERLYVRDKHDFDSVKNKNARLINVSAGNQVLADKVSDMDARVVELLGMSFDDFSRAVILPQGKFDQFLKLTGGDRAKMLENIFRLDRFGENLWKKTSQLESQLQQQLNINQRLTDQLGDASEETLKQADEQLSVHKQLVLEKGKAKKAAEAEISELEYLAKSYSEIDLLLTEKETLEAEGPIMQRKRALLERARKAEPLKNLINQIEDLSKRKLEEEKSVTTQSEKLKALQDKVRVLSEKLEQAQENERELNQLKETELPRIALAAEYEMQRAGLEKELSETSASLTKRNTYIELITREGKEKGTALTRAQEKISGLVIEGQRISSLLECRREVEQAIELLTKLEVAEKQEKEAKDILLKREGVLEAEGKKLITLAEENLNLSSLGKYKGNLADLMKRIQQTVINCSEKYRLAETELNEMTLKNMAVALSEQLCDGEPCPVCGATSHPSPATGKNLGEDLGENWVVSAREMVKKTREELEILNKWEQRANLVYNTYNNIAKEVADVHLPNAEDKVKLRHESSGCFESALAALRNKFPEKSELNQDQNTPEVRVVVRQLKVIMEKADRKQKELTEQIESLQEEIKKLEVAVSSMREEFRGAKVEKEALLNNTSVYEIQLGQLNEKILDITGGISSKEYGIQVQNRVKALEQGLCEARKAWERGRDEEQEGVRALDALKVGLSKTVEHINSLNMSINQDLAGRGFIGIEEVKAAILSDTIREETASHLEEYGKALNHVGKRLNELQASIKGKPFEPIQLKQARYKLNLSIKEYDDAVREEGGLSKKITDLLDKQVLWQQLRQENSALTRRKELAAKLVSLIKGRRFVQFLAEEHLSDMAAEASLRLGILTGHRYALELDEGCSFVMRDDYSGSQRRPVNTLSGGETFLTSLSMALALSSKIQLKGQYPLGFFFLDEGFGTLDPDKLETVMDTLEKLHDGQRMVGVITHVPELRNRMPRYLEVIPVKQDGTGSKVVLKKN